MADGNFHLLEWYAAHRGEVDLVRDPPALFALGLLEHIGETSRAEFQQDLGVTATQLDQTIEKLYAEGFVATRGTSLAITPQGKQFLSELGLRGPLPPSTASEQTPWTPKPPPPVAAAPRTPLWLWGLIGTLIVGILLVFGVLPNLPGIRPPTKIAVDTATPANGRDTPSNGAPTVTPPTPVVGLRVDITFSGEPASVAPGECAILTWKVVGGREVFMDAQPVREQARQRVCPNESTTYTLTVISMSGEKLAREVAVGVSQPRPDYVWSIVGKNPPFDSLRLQNALAHALDVPAISKSILQEAGQLRSADPKLDELSYDVERARELLIQAKYDRQPVQIVFNPDPTSREIANLIEKYLAAAGFNSQLSGDLDSQTTIFVGPE